ncbi:hypothetical protein [Shewanella donghaensis]|uniref:hypothetical protein n=1 Tax=Shewanella donghaensis TaxID=238836 RepID=UPI0011820656|nr:hypothetical protein [Shewanella donghaensis]
MEKLENGHLYASIEEPSEVNLKGDESPSLAIIKEALSSQNIDKLNNINVIPGTDVHSPIKFLDDIWTSKNLKSEAEGYRRANFIGLPKPLKDEIKVIGVYLLWFNFQKAKLSSLIRIIENLIVISKHLSELKIKSIFWLDREPIKEQFIIEFSKNRSEGTIDNYFKSLSKICDMKYTFFGDFGFFLKTNYKYLSPGRKDNQTFCMPIRVLNSYWNSYIDYFDNCNVNTKNWRYLTSLHRSYAQYLSDNNHKKHHSLWLKYLFEMCQNKLSEIHNDSSCVLSSLVIKQKLEGRKKYGNRFPEFIVRTDDIFDFYNRNALIACEAIQAMTGMRKSEAMSTKISSLIDEKDWVGVKSIVHKHADEGGIEEWWAAAPYIKKVFKFIRVLAKELFLDSDLESLYIKTDARVYMSNGSLVLMRTQRNSENLLNWSRSNNIVLVREDIEEFWQLNPNIERPDVVREVIKAGMTWPVKSHQYRRSIAVHIRRLDLVTMNQMSVQLKHIGKTVTDWYSEGALANSSYIGRISDSFAKELDKVDLEFSANIAMKFQFGKGLFGSGGKQLENQNKNDIKSLTFQSFNHAKSMAKRKKKKVMSLGNGMYCLNGIDCDFKSVIQSSNCKASCENLVADKESIPIWISRYNRYRVLYLKSVEEKKPEASQEFLRLEMEFYMQALTFYGVIL